MIRRRLLTALVVSSFVATLLLSACEMTGFDLEETFVDFTAKAAMLDKNDPPSVAAWDVGPEAHRITAAELQFELAIAGADPAGIDKAIEARPRDPRYRLYKAALQVATGDKALETTAGQALSLISLNHPELPATEQDRAFVDGFLYSLWDLSTHYDRGTAEWNRLRDQYCYTLRAYEKTYQRSDYPRETCT